MTHQTHTGAARVGNLIRGTTPPGETRMVERFNPADLRERVSIAPNSTAQQARAAIEAVTTDAGRWSRLTPPERGKIVLRTAQLIEARRDALAALITWEQGKPISESYAELKRATDILEYVAGMGRRLCGQTLPSESEDVFCYTARQPIGAVALISPWNIPFAIPCWKIAPAFVCGCPIVFKPSPFTPVTATRVVELFLEAGLPPEAIALVHGGPKVGEEMVGNPLVAGISFTGSTKVGTAIHAAAAPRLAKTQLEMGGKNPQIVLADADIDLAVDACMVAGFDVSGQRCTCTSRVIVADAVAHEFTEALLARIQAVKLGNGNDPTVGMGPLIDETRLSAVEAFVDRACREGAEVLAGGARPDGLSHGNFYPPTLLAGIDRRHEIAREEVFGPVIALMRVDGIDDAIEVANDSQYGLAASIFTRDIGRVFGFVDKIEAGMVHVNRPTLGGFSHFPFGGQKNSSFGPREVGDDTIGFYTGLKSVYVRHRW